ncbi:MAG: hypothetical protein LBS62_10935 [Clostridiales bacterium]|nr:hypothetical protein [Clostridiales bacterium]
MSDNSDFEAAMRELLGRPDSAAEETKDLFNASGGQPDSAGGSEFNINIDGVPSDTDNTDDTDEGELDEISDAQLAEINDMFKMFESDINVSEDISQMLTSPDSLDDASRELDDILAEAVAKAEAEDFSINLNDDSEFISTIEVYDTEDRSNIHAMPEEAPQPEEPIFDERATIGEALKKGRAIPLKILYMVAGAILGLIVLTIAASVVVTIVVDASRPVIPDNSIVITHSPSGVNNANYIYLNTSAMYMGSPLVLQRVLLDSEAAVFYFDRQLSPSLNAARLTDESGREYALLNGASGGDEMAGEAGTSGNLKEKRGLNKLSFEPIALGTRIFTLTIAPRVEEGAEIAFNFYVQNGVKSTAKIYIYNAETDPAPLPAEEPNLAANAGVENDGVVSIIDSTFSSAGSFINYRLKWGRDSRLVNIFTSGVNDLELSSAGETILPRWSAPEEALFEDSGATLGCIEFEPVSALVGNAKVTFNSLYESYPLDLSISAASVLNKPSGQEQVIAAGKYDLVLERLVLSNESRYILVFHVEDRTIPKIPLPEDRRVTMDDYLYNRVEGRMDVRLVATASDGRGLTLDGVTRSSQLGADVVFESGDLPFNPFAEPGTVINLRIAALHVKAPPVTVAFELGRAASAPAVRDVIDAAVAGAFNSRLAYMAGEIPLGDIRGFMPEAMYAQRYSPRGQSGGSYYAQVVTGYEEDGVFYGIVKERFQAVLPENDLALTHKVTARAIDGQWVIDNDEIIG